MKTERATWSLVGATFAWGSLKKIKKVPNHFDCTAINYQSRFATPWSLLVWDRCFPYLNISEIPIQFIWERPEIEVLVLYLVVIDLHSRLGGIRPARCVKPALGGSPRPRFRPRLVSKGPDYSNALRCARTPVPCVKTTCRVRRRPWDLSLRRLCKSINTKLNCGKPSEDGGVKQDTTALEWPVAAS